MKNNFKATKTVIALAVAGLMSGVAFAATEAEEGQLQETNYTTTATTAEAVKAIDNTVTSNRVTDPDATGDKFGAVFINGVTSDGTLADGLVFANNVSAGKGGALTIDNSTITANNATFSNNTAAGQGGAIRLYAEESKEASLTLSYDKDVVLSGNRADVGNGDDLTAGGQSAIGFKDQGGFAYLKGDSNGTQTLTINANGATVTIGNPGAAANVDSIASIGNNNIVNFGGDGVINMNGSMEAFTGTINVTGGVTVNMATGFGSWDNAAQYYMNGLNAKDNANTTPSFTTVTNSLSIGAKSVVNMNDTLEITSTTNVTVASGAEFNVDGIAVVPTEYKDSSDLAGKGKLQTPLTTTAIGTLDADGDVTVKHDLVVNGTNAAYTIKGDGYVDVQGAINVANGSLTLTENADVDATSLTVGFKGATTEEDTIGSVIVGQNNTLAADVITFTTDDSSLQVNGTLETLSNNLYTVENDTAKQVSNITLGQNAVLSLTDETFDADTWNALDTALGNFDSFTFETGTFQIADGSTLGYKDLDKYRKVGHAVVTRGSAVEAGQGSLNQMNNDVTLGAFDFATPAADAKTILNLGSTSTDQYGKLTFRGTETGDVFLGAGEATISLGDVAFGQEDEDFGTINNKVLLTENTEVEAGSFTFAEEVDLGGKYLDANEGAELTISTVKAGATGTVRAMGGKVNYVGTIDPDNKTLTVYGAATVANGGTYVVGTAGGEAIKDTNTYYIGQKTVIAGDMNFGTGTSDTATKNLIVVDMQAVANTGFDPETDGVLSVGTIKDNTTKGVTVELTNLDKRLTSSEANEEGINTYTLNLGKLGNGSAITANSVEVEGNSSIFGNKWNVTTASTAENVTTTIVMDTDGDSAYHNLHDYQSGVADQMISEMNNLSGGTNDLTRALWSLTDADIETVLGANGTKDELVDLALNSADDVSISAIASGAMSANFDYTYEVAKTLDRRMSIANLNAARNPSGMTPWVDVFGTANEAKSLFDDSDGHYGYEADIYGAVLGFDWTAPCGAIIGAAVNVGTSDANSVGDFSTDSDADSDYYGISIYGSHRIGNFNGKVDFGYIHSKNDITTKTFFGNFDESLDADIFTFGLGAEYLANVGAFNVAPHAGIRWSRLDMDSSEYGADYDAMNLFQMPMGVTFSGTIETAGMKIAPMIDISVVPAFGDKDAVASFTSGYEETVRVVDTNPVQMTLGVTGQVDAWTFGVNYGLSAGGEDRLNNSFNLNARYTF